MNEPKSYSNEIDPKKGKLVHILTRCTLLFDDSI